nr:MAG TPA: hypothetical protein [Crassvirales sp.]
MCGGVRKTNKTEYENNDIKRNISMVYCVP